MNFGVTLASSTGLEIVTDTVINVTNIFSLATKNSGIVATLATRFLFDLDLNKKSKVKTGHLTGCGGADPHN